MSPPRALFPRRRPTVDASSLEDGVDDGVELVVVVVVVVLRARRARRRVSIRARARFRAGRWAGDHATPRHPRVQMLKTDETTHGESRLANWTRSIDPVVCHDIGRIPRSVRPQTLSITHDDDRPHPGHRGHPGHRPTDRPTDRPTGDGRRETVARADARSVRRSVGPSVRRSSRASRSKSRVDASTFDSDSDSASARRRRRQPGRAGRNSVGRFATTEGRRRCRRGNRRRIR